MCHLIWLLSRKYGTVWYHPASSKPWYLTALSFVNFQENLTGTSFSLCACEASFVRLAVCLALSALFASTPPFSKLRDKSVQGRHAPGQLLDVFDACGSFHAGDGGDLLGVCFDAAMANDEAE
jgi:hypothetical protein